MLQEALRATFRPEFLNRIDDVVMFHALTLDEIAEIVELQLEEVRARLAERKIALELTPAAIERLSLDGFDPVFGARPLKRLIQREVVDRVAKALIDGEVHEGDTVTVDVGERRVRTHVGKWRCRRHAMHGSASDDDGGDVVMAIMRWDPFGEMLKMQRDMDRIFSRMGTAEGAGGDRDTAWMPRINVKQSGDDLAVHVELAGIKPEDVDIEVTDGVLTISGERKAAAEREDEGWMIRESSYGSFERSIALPEGVDPASIQADFHDGMLEIHVPRALEAARPKTTRSRSRGRQRLRPRRALPRPRPRCLSRSRASRSSRGLRRTSRHVSFCAPRPGGPTACRVSVRKPARNSCSALQQESSGKPCALPQCPHMIPTK